MADYDQVTVATHRYIRRNGPKLVDNVFKRGATMKYFRDTLKEDFSGGRLLQDQILYQITNGGPYAPGGTFNVSQKQLFESIEFNPKYFYENITLYKEHIQVLNKADSDAAIFSIVKEQVDVAFRSIGAKINVALFFDGQRAGWENNINGLPEAIQDNASVGATSWLGTNYSAYGGKTRGGKVGTALNSPVVDVDGTLEYTKLEETYMDACVEEEPNLIITTKRGQSYVNEKFQAQQTYTSVVDQKTGLTATKFKNANILWDAYCPGSELSGGGGRTDLVATSFLDELFPGAGTVYPAQTTTAGAAAESLIILTAKQPYINFYVTDDSEYAFGFTGFKPAQDSTVLCGQILFAGNLSVPAPRVHRWMKRISG